MSMVERFACVIVMLVVRNVALQLVVLLLNDTPLLLIWWF